MSELNRREFVAAAVAAVAACACLSCPMESFAAAGATGGFVDIGAVSDYSKDGITDKFIRPNRLVVIRNDGKIYASSAVCTHKASILTVRGSELACPKHGSHFSINGTVTKGPAKDSLVRYEIKKNDAGHLIINTENSFREKDWEKPDSFISVT